MPYIVIKNFENVGEEGQYYTTTCTHVHESDESDMAAEVRIKKGKKQRKTSKFFQLMFSF
jgi:hypothetical protein